MNIGQPITVLDQVSLTNLAQYGCSIHMLKNLKKEGLDFKPHIFGFLEHKHHIFGFLKGLLLKRKGCKPSDFQKEAATL